MADAVHQQHPDPSLAPGTRVEVRRRLDGRWARGFEVITYGDDGLYRVRRLSDDVELPVQIVPDDIRQERKKSTWWY
jgi:hypothetical protein